MVNKNGTAYFSDMQLSRLYKLHQQRKFLSQISEKNLIEHLQPINLNPKLILDLSSDNIIDFSSYNLYPHAKVTHIKPIIQHNTEVKLNIFSKLWQKNQHNIFYCPILTNMPNSFKSKSFDMIYSNLMLSYQYNLPDILKCYANLLEDNGLIIFSMFSLGSAIELPFKLPLIDMHDIGDILMHSGFYNPIVDVQRINLSYNNANIKSLLKDLQAFGILKPSHNCLNSRQYYAQLCDKFSHIKNISIEISYAHAWKTPQNAKNNKNIQVINIDKLKKGK